MAQFKKYWYVLVIIVILILLGIQKHKTNRLSDKIQLQSVELSTLNDSVAVYRSKNGELTYRVSSIQVESDSRKKALETANFDIKELKQRNIKLNDVVFALKGQIEALGSGTTILRDTIWKNSIDTIFASKFTVANRFLTFNATIIQKNVEYNYKYKTPIDFVSEKKNNNYVVSAYLGDPYASIVSANSITIVPKKKWGGWKYIHVGIGLGLGYFLFK